MPSPPSSGEADAAGDPARPEPGRPLQRDAPFAWALSKFEATSDPAIGGLLGHHQAARLSEALEAARKLAFGEPASEAIQKQGRAFDRRLKTSPRDAIAALYELLVLGLFRSQMWSLTGVEARGKGPANPDYHFRSLAEEPFIVEVKTLFRGERLLEYEPRLREFQDLLVTQLERRGHRVASLEVLAAPSQIPSSPSDIRACIMAAESEIRAAKAKNRRFCSAKTPRRAPICIELADVQYDLSNMFGRRLQELDQMRGQMERSIGQQRLWIASDGEEYQDYERRIRYKIGGKLAQLEKSGSQEPWVVAVCVADPELSLRRATAAALRFLKERSAAREDKTPLAAALVVSFFHPEFAKLFRRASEDMKKHMTEVWSRVPLCAVQGVWVRVSDSAPRMNSMRTVDAAEAQSLWQEDKHPWAMIMTRLLQDHSRHDPRLVPPDSAEARFLAITQDGRRLAGWSGIERTLDQLPLCMRDLSRCTGVPAPGEVVEIVRADQQQGE
jgi:hypothetical protein